MKFHPLSANATNGQTQQPTNYLTVFDHFVGSAIKGLKIQEM